MPCDYNQKKLISLHRDQWNSHLYTMADYVGLLEEALQKLKS